MPKPRISVTSSPMTDTIPACLPSSTAMILQNRSTARSPPCRKLAADNTHMTRSRCGGASPQGRQQDDLHDSVEEEGDTHPEDAHPQTLPRDAQRHPGEEQHRGEDHCNEDVLVGPVPRRRTVLDEVVGGGLELGGTLGLGLVVLRHLQR